MSVAWSTATSGCEAYAEDYALIGDCETAALVGRDGSLDWLCWPRFDSPACFAALLGGPEHGRWLIAPASKVMKTSRAYRADTLILETRFETSEGVVLLTDFMPLRGTNSDVVRRVTGLQGRVSMRTELIIRADYGRTFLISRRAVRSATPAHAPGCSRHMGQHGRTRPAA